MRLPRNSGFVTTNGTAFVLNGQAFRVAGANNYYLGYAPDSMAAAVFDLADQMNFNVLRTWAFLDCGAAEPGCTPANAKDGIFFHYWDSATGSPAFNDGPNGLERLDRTIALAEQHGIRLILPLVNYWDDFGGVNQYLSWFGLRGRDRFYRNSDVKDAYRAYLEHLALRVNTRTGRCYRDEPAILAWELANEPRCVADDGSPLPDGTGTLIDWVHEMSTWLKSIDPNHLVAVGDEGYFRCERLLQVPDIDFGTCHLYPDYAAQGDPIAFGVRWIRKHIEAGQRAHKPMLIEEYGWKAGRPDPAAGSVSRNAAFENWLNQVDRSGGAGALVWMIASVTPDGRRYPDYDHYTIYAPDDAPSLLDWATQQSGADPEPAAASQAARRFR